MTSSIEIIATGPLVYGTKQGGDLLVVDKLSAHKRPGSVGRGGKLPNMHLHAPLWDQRQFQADSERMGEVVELLAGKWTVEILCTIRYGPVRLSQLRRSIPHASKKALTARLRRLQDANVVIRTDLSGSVLHVEYDFAENMRKDVASLLDYLMEWALLLHRESE